MDIFRPIFIFLLTVVSITLLSYSTWQLWHGVHPMMSWLGLLLASAAPLLFLALKQVFAIHTPTRYAMGFSTLCGLGLAISMTSSWKYGDVAGNTHLGAGLCLVLWVFYLRRFARKSDTQPTI